MGAYQKGLTADAPPDGRLSLARYTFANVDKAKAQMRRLAETAQPPSLVHTADADDQIVRQDGDSAIARHGVVVTVIDGSEVRDNARQRADWTYRIEALALQRPARRWWARRTSAPSRMSAIWSRRIMCCRC